MRLVSCVIIFVFASRSILILYLFWFDDSDSSRSQTKMEFFLHNFLPQRSCLGTLTDQNMQYSAAGVPKLILCWNLLRRKILKAIVTIWIYLILQIVLLHENHVLRQTFQTVALLILWLCRFYKSVSLLRCITFNSLSLLLSGWWWSLCKICKLGSTKTVHGQGM